MAGKLKLSQVPTDAAADEAGAEEKPRKRRHLVRVKRKLTDNVRAQIDIPLGILHNVDLKARLEGTTRSGLMAQWAAEKTKHLNKGELSSTEGQEEAAA